MKKRKSQARSSWRVQSWSDVCDPRSRRKIQSSMIVAVITSHRLIAPKEDRQGHLLCSRVACVRIPHSYDLLCLHPTQSPESPHVSTLDFRLYKTIWTSAYQTKLPWFNKILSNKYWEVWINMCSAIVSEVQAATLLPEVSPRQQELRSSSRCPQKTWGQSTTQMCWQEWFRMNYESIRLFTMSSRSPEDFRACASQSIDIIC